MSNKLKTLEEKELYVKQQLQGIANALEEILPKGFGFTLLTYAHNESGEMMYVSNSKREDVVKAMEEFIEKTKTTYGNDTGKY